MSFSYNTIIDNTKSKDVEKNKNFNIIILNANSTKKKSSQEDIDIMKNKCSNKIFDVIKLDEKMYFYDKELNYLWDEDVNLVGIKHNNLVILWSDIDLIMNQMHNDLYEIKEFFN
jgi:hypothetical protein